VNESKKKQMNPKVVNKNQNISIEGKSVNYKFGWTRRESGELCEVSKRKKEKIVEVSNFCSL
jgi:hypothetical protein